MPPTKPPTPPAVPRISERRARREYLCGDPDKRGCDQRILIHDVYVELSWPPGTAPYHSGSWVMIKCCNQCRRPATTEVVACPIASQGRTCLLPEGHLDHGQPHEYAIGLF